ncbi:hypothetical protein C2S53_018899 [Perilla frutescens var. hirtella]|uniref:Ubiquitin-like protease family profile domain-containing protein n=1 Tax=Perilla frutescens var. hirtella TaxID=608512 RepID=A0AAD4J5K6_PERFH|nr:hypothetical protein C2S53_018899 [Perilla frutescens var. hirtella]
MSESSSRRGDKYFLVCDCQKPVRTYVSNRPHSRENSGESHSSKFKMSPEDVTEDMRTMAECMRLMARGLKHTDAEVAALRKRRWTLAAVDVVAMLINLVAGDREGVGDSCAQRGCAGVLLLRRSNLAVLNTIRDNLDDVNFEKMKGSCFGHLFQQTEFSCQGQLLATLLKKLQRHSLGRMRLSFKINNDIVEFGPKEFAVKTGLKLAGDTETPSTSAFYSEVFKNKKPLYFIDIEKKLEAAHKAGQAGSETSYKLAFLLVVYGILLTKDRTSKAVTLEYLHVVDDGQRFNNFPWGKAWLYEIMPSIANRYAVSVGAEGDMFPRMLRWCVLKTMTTVYDEVRPFFSKKNSGVKEEPILLELGLHDFEESIESLRDAVDDYGSTDDCLDSSDDEINTDGANVKGKRKLDGSTSSPWSRPGKRTRSSQPDDSTSHVLSRLCANSDEMLAVMRDLCTNVARIADNVAAMQFDLHRLVKEGHGDAGADLFGAGDGHFTGDEDVHIVGSSYDPHGVGANEPASQPATEGVKPIDGASAQTEGEDEAMRAKQESFADTELEDSDKTRSLREGEGKLNADIEASVRSEEEDDDNQSPQKEGEDEEEDGDTDDEESSAQTEAEASDESSSGMEESGDSETSSVQERREEEDVTKDAGESSSHQAADGVGIDSQPADTNANIDDSWDVTLAKFLGMGKTETSHASESTAEAAAEGPRHDPSMMEPVSNPSLEEFRRWYNEQRKLPHSSQTEVKLPDHDLVWTPAPWFDGLCKRYGWLNTTHIDALLNLILSKVKRAPDTFADNWAVIETYLWGTLQKGETSFAIGTLVPYVLGMSPRMLKRPWVKVEKVYGIGNVNDDHWRHFTTISRYIPSACKRAGLWRKRQPPAAALLDQWPVVSNGDTPQQTNNHDCDIMALKILECLCAGIPIHVIDPAKCGRYRNDYTTARFQLTKELSEEEGKQGRAAAATFSTMNQRPQRDG